MSTPIPGSKKTDIFLLDPSQLEIITDEKHVLYDERLKLPISEALVRSIMKIGVKVPILARRDGERMIVVDGRQRVRATVEANKRLVDMGMEPVRIPTKMERATEQDLFDTMIAANEIRQADSPLVLARKVQKSLDMGRTLEEVGITFGREIPALKQLLAVLECAPEVQKAVSAGLSVTAAARLAKLPHEEQVKLLEEMPKDGSTVREVQKKVQQKTGGKVDDSPSKKLIKKVMHELEAQIAADKKDEKELRECVQATVSALRWVLTGSGDKNVKVALKVIESESEGG